MWLMKLSIIIPYYNTLEYTKRLFEVLEPQLTDEVEVLIIDDGCNEKELDNLKATVIHLPTNSGRAGRPRNVGLDQAKGDYVAFIDSDDMVSEDYISEILKKISKNPDVIYLSWKSKVHEIIITNRPPKWNCAVWCRVYKREVIGNVRFKENLIIAEDWWFVHDIKVNSSLSITKQIYIYTIGREGSLMDIGTRQ